MNSGNSRRSRFFETAAVAVSLSLLIAAFAYWLFEHRYLLYYGDAQAHLNISRSLIDSRNPGYEQLGTVWLPLLHVICLPFVADSMLWSTGLAGTIPVAACFVVAGTFFFLSARIVYQNTFSAFAVLLCFALNPNMLYLGSIAMTEAVFLAGLSVAFWAILQLRAAPNPAYLILALLASWCMSLTRYDGWFLIPFIALASKRRWLVLPLSIAPLYWLAHNWWQTSNALDFINGPYSAAAIQGNRPYPGLHNWLQAFQYYFQAGKLCSGWPLVILGSLGAFLALWQRQTRPIFFLLLTPAFYVWSLHSSKTPIHVPTLWPFSYYNTRYGIALFVFFAFAVGALVRILPGRILLALSFLALIPWLTNPKPDAWICWKESEQNSLARRAWTAAGARFLQANYTAGDGVLFHFGDLTGIFSNAQIPLRETIHDGNGPEFLAATTAPAAFHPAKWALALSDSPLWRQPASSYKLIREIHLKDSPALQIYQRIR